MSKNFRLANCSFSNELRFRQILRGIGICGIASLLITAKLQEHGHLISIDPSALQSLFAPTSDTAIAPISTYTASQAVAVTSINNLLAGQKPATDSRAITSTTPPSSISLPLNWSIIRATIKASFAQAATQAGLTRNEMRTIKTLLADQIDFNHFTAQDHFKVLLARDNQSTTHTSSILALEITQAKKTVQIFQYHAPNGTINYYQADGRSLNPGFLRYPTHYIGIGSGFSSNRLDPITGQYHSHPAVDFRAPMGAPIVATGNGRIQFMAWQTGYGNVVKIAHPGQITTLYAHMKNFAKGLHAGAMVKAGQIIGYVGMTGYATGPHVHYEFRINGQPYNALTVKLPSAPGLNGSAKQAFLKQTSLYQHYLNSAQSV